TIDPQWIRQAGSHMVRQNVQYQTQAPCRKCAAQFVEFFKSADLWVEHRRIRHIITMRAAGTRFENGRRIQIGDTKFMQVVDKPQGIRESEVTIELQSVSRDRDPHGGSNTRWLVSDPLPPSAALPLTEGENKALTLRT